MANHRFRGSALAQAFREKVRLDFVGLRKGKGLILSVAAFFDDAGTHAQALVSSWGGLVGTVDQWVELTERWLERLDNPFPGDTRQMPALSEFGLADCQGRRGEFEAYSATDSSSLQYEMRKIIGDVGLVGVAFSVDKRAWDALAPPEARALLGSAEDVCFRACFNGGHDQAREFWPDEIAMAIYFDKVSHSGRMEALQKIVDEQAYQPYGTPLPLINGVTFGEAKQYPPIQAADTIATEQCWYSQRLIGHPVTDRRAHFDAYCKQIRAKGMLMRADEIRKTLSSYGFEPNEAP